MHKYAGQTVREILREKQARIRQAPLDPGSPGWDDIMDMDWEEVERRAQDRETGYRSIKKLLTDGRFDK